MFEAHEALTFHPLPKIEPTMGDLGIGDLKSTERGSAARFNAGKPDMSLIPLRLIGENALLTLDADRDRQQYAFALIHLGHFQETGDTDYLHQCINSLGAPWEACARVFEYGKVKYAPWNWAKGFAWSTVIASAARHIIFGLLRGEINDPESNLPHTGHVMCNLVMLLTFQATYQEGNDLPVAYLNPSK